MSWHNPGTGTGAYMVSIPVLLLHCTVGTGFSIACLTYTPSHYHSFVPQTAGCMQASSEYDYLIVEGLCIHPKASGPSCARKLVYNVCRLFFRKDSPPMEAV